MRPTRSDRAVPRPRRAPRIVVVAAAVLLVLLGGGAASAWNVLDGGVGATPSGSLVSPTVTATRSTSAPSSRIDLAWTAPGQLSGATYEVVRATGSTSAPLAGCTTSPCADTGLAAGTTYTYTVTARLGGWTRSGQASQSTEAVARPTTTVVTSSINPVRSNTEMTFTATVAPQGGTGTPTGAVAFKDGATTLTCVGGAPALSSGTATCRTSFPTFGAARSITAVYAGDTGFTGSSSAVLSQRVVNDGVKGMSAGGVKVNGAAVTTSCLPTSTGYACNAGTAGNNAVLSVDSVTFLSQAGSPVVFATDAPTSVSWSSNGKSAGAVTGTFTIAANATTSSAGTASGTKNGSNAVTLTMTLVEGGGSPVTVTVTLG